MREDPRTGRLAVAVGLTIALAEAVRAATLPVNDVAQLRAAVQAALPGDDIVLAPGDYRLDATVSVSRPGAAGAAIRVRAAVPGCSRLLSNTVEAFNVSAPWWTFEDLELAGICADDSTCEHAFHVVGGADFFILRRSSVHDFNAQIKGNGVDPGSGRNWPDDVLIEGNEIFDSRPRQTANPVTKIDVVGGQRWVVRGNFIHDGEKALGDTISYAAFLKGNGRDGVFEGNLVACSWATTGGVRVGLSLGGGGSSPDPICEQGTCTPEHRNGILRNNLIVACNDVGIYLNEAQDCQVHHNTLYDTAGIDVRFPASVVDLRNNLLSGVIRSRNGGVMTLGSNLEGVALATFRSWFADPGRLDFRLVGDGSAFLDRGEPVAAVSDDLCRNPRLPLSPDIGAVEYGPAPCDSRSLLVPYVAWPAGPPVGVGNSLRASRASALPDVLLGWAAGSDRAWNLYRDRYPGLPGSTLGQGLLRSPGAIDPGVVDDGALYFYRARALGPCDGSEAE